MTNNKDSLIVALALVIGVMVGYMVAGFNSSVVPQKAQVVENTTPDTVPAVQSNEYQNPNSKTFAVTDHFASFVEKLKAYPSGYTASGDEASNIFVGWSPSPTDTIWSLTCTSDWNGAVVGHAWLAFNGHFYLINAWGNMGGFGVTCTAVMTSL